MEVTHAGNVGQIDLSRHKYRVLARKPIPYWYCRDAVRNQARTGKVSGQSYEAYLRTVWSINTQASPTSHSATYPRKLVERAVLLTTPQYSCGACGKPYNPALEVDEAPCAEAVSRCGGANGYNGQATKDYGGALAQDPSATKSRILASLVRKTITDFVMCLVAAVYGEEPRRRSKGVSRRRPESVVVKYEQMGLF